MDEGLCCHRFVVASDAPSCRLDRFLADSLRDADVSREKIKRAILAGFCRVDSHPCSAPSLCLQEGQCVELTLTPVSSRVAPEAGDLEVVFQDDFLTVINKAAGLTVHPCPSCSEVTLVHHLAEHFPAIRSQEGLRPGIVHRLDKDTSGLLVVALSEEARLRLAISFARREVQKEYLALVRGVPSAFGECDSPMGRDPVVKVRMAVVKDGRPASTDWQVAFKDDRSRFSLLRVRIHTGRTHQIRVHMAHIGHPLWGDKVYGLRSDADPASRQMLHAWRLSFTHPFTEEEMSFSSPPPADFLHALDKLDHRMQRVVLTGTPGCGKSTVLETLAEAGLPVWSADAAVRRLYEPGEPGWQVLRQRYADRFVADEAAPVDRRALAQALLEDTFLRRDLERVIHPMVHDDLEAFWTSQESAGVERAVAEIPLYFESGWKQPEGFTPVVAGVRCDPEVRHGRLATLRKWSPELIAGMDSWQWPELKKLQNCDLVVDNRGSVESLKQSARKLLEQLKSIEYSRKSACTKAWMLALADDSSSAVDQPFSDL